MCVAGTGACDPNRVPEGRLVGRKEAADLGAGSRVEGTRALTPRCRQCALLEQADNRGWQSGVGAGGDTEDPRFHS